MSDITIDHKILLKNAEGENLEPYVTTDSVLSTESNLPVQNAPVANRFRDVLYFDEVDDRKFILNGTVVGDDVTVDNLAVASGFSNKSYIYTPDNDIRFTQNAPFEIGLKVKFNSFNTESGLTTIFYMYHFLNPNDLCDNIRLAYNSDSKLSLWLAISRGQFGLAKDVLSKTTFNLNTWYYFKISTTSNGYNGTFKLESSTDKANWITEWSFKCDRDNFCEGGISMFGYNLDNRWPYIPSPLPFTQGEIDFKECYIKSGNNIAWTGATENN